MAGMLLYKRTRSAVRKWGDIFVDKIKQSVKVDGTYASGRTHNSIEGKFGASGDIIKYEISSRVASNSDYSVLELIDQGRRKGRRPPMQAIKYWMEQKGVRPRTRGGKFMESSEKNMVWAAFNISRAIGNRGTIERFGYRGSDVLGYVYRSQEQAMIEDIANSFESDVTEYIEKGVKRPIIGKR